MAVWRSSLERDALKCACVRLRAQCARKLTALWFNAKQACSSASLLDSFPMHTLPASDLRAYYSAALAGLRFVEARRPTQRRFGAEADARWGGFRGDLTTADRLDLLLRDADAEWPGAFGARTVFAQTAVAEDDAFGPTWLGLDPVDGETVWRSGLAAAEPRDLEALLAAWSTAWACPLGPMIVDASGDRLVVAGPSAIAGLLRVFAGRTDLSWSDQVTLVATPPAHRQLAAFATAALNLTKPTVVLTHARAQGLVGRVIVSDDAAPEDARAAGESVR